MARGFPYYLLLVLALHGPGAHASIQVDTHNLQLEFSTFGDLLSGTACMPACSEPDARRQVFTSFRGFISINRNSNSAFELERRSGEHSIELVFSHLLSGEIRRWRIPHRGYQVGLELVRPQGLSMASGEPLFPSDAPGFSGWLESMRYLRIVEGEASQSGLDEAFQVNDSSGQWLGYRNRYWTAMLQAAAAQSARAGGSAEHVAVHWDGPATATVTRYAIYAGPVEPGALVAADPQLKLAAYPGLLPGLRGLCLVMYRALNAVQRVVGNWGFSILLLAFMVQLLTLPLSRYAARVQAGVRDTENRLAPALRDIKQRYSGGEQAERILGLYKEQGVHPLYSFKAMVGLLFLAPVFIAVFGMLSEHPWLAGQSFLWIENLARPDTIARLPFPVPWLGNGLQPLPVIMAMIGMLGTWLQNRAISEPALRRRQNRRAAWISVVFALLFYTFPSGMVLYWTGVNAFVVFERLISLGRNAPSSEA